MILWYFYFIMFIKFFYWVSTGGHEVSSSDGNFVFYINVCRGIKPKKDDNIHCPANSSMCRVDKNLQKPEDVGSISYTSGLILRDKNDIVLVYNTTKTVSGCPKNLNPATTITFRCPGRNRVSISIDRIIVYVLMISLSQYLFYYWSLFQTEKSGL